MYTFVSRSGKTITVRPPQVGDEGYLFRFAQTIQAEDTYILLNPFEPVTWEEEVKYLNDTLKRIDVGWQVHYLAFDGDKLIGSSQVATQGRRKKHVGSFGISLLKDYRGEGIGTALSTYVLSEAQKQLHISLVTLECFKQNLIAQKLYHSLGFTQYGILPGALRYRAGFDTSILMYKVLN